MIKAKRFPFTEKENLIIVQMVKFYGEDWELISKQLPGRTAKQIHDRYHNYLRQGLRNSPWTIKEDEILIRMYNAIGPKWSKMMNNLPGRSGNDIKNRWHKHLYKKLNDKKNLNLKLNTKVSINNQSNFKVSPKNDAPENQKNVIITNKSDANVKSTKFNDNVFDQTKNSLFSTDFEVQDIFEEINSQNIDFLWI